jgi:AmmeMemoRadiSam system protein B
MVPLASILKYYKKFKVVHISMGFIDFDYLDEFGKILREAIDESDSACVLISSGDLSHKLSEDGPYGYSELAKVFDEKVTDIFRTSKLDELSNIPTEIIEDSAQCGLRSFITLAGCFDSKKVRSKLLSYEGPFGVGYCVAKFNEQ